MALSKRQKGVLAGGGALLVLVAVICAVAHLAQSPDVALLVNGPATWITVDAPIELTAQVAPETTTCFRKRFSSPALVKTNLVVRAMKAIHVVLDRQVVYSNKQNLAEWKQEKVVPLEVSAGAHDLKIYVMNRYGPACLLAYCPELGLATDGGWEASEDDVTWMPALPVDTPRRVNLGGHLPPVSAAFLSKIPFLLGIFLPVFLWVFLSERAKNRQETLGKARWFDTRHMPRAKTWRWLFVIAWIVLALNNMAKLPEEIGFDFTGHGNYIRFIMSHWRLPLATDGWTMFQAPFYYMLAAAVNGLLGLVLKPEFLAYRWYMLRAISLAAGIAQIEIGYRGMRYLWPDREDLQTAGTFFAGFLPMNLYMSQYLGNEPLTGCLVGIVVMLCLKHLNEPESGQQVRPMIVLGLVLGLAGLTKMTALSMALPVFMVLVAIWWNSDRAAGSVATHIAAACAVVFGMAVLVCGWFYLRNWLVLGRPFWGGWEPEREILWWQYPGYRTLGQFLQFGECLQYPVYSGLASFWDGFYSTLWLDGYLSSMVNLDFPPPWNFNLMLSGAWLALLPTAAILAGLVALFKGAPVVRRAALFATGCLALYGAAMFYGFCTVPYYCIMKASYTLGLIPCYAVLLTAGLSLCRKPLLKAVAYGGLAAWGVAAYTAYFIVHAP